MLKRILLAVVILSFCSTAASAQDIFVAFGQGLDAGVDGARNVDGVAGDGDTTGTAFIFINGDQNIGAIDLLLSTENTDVVSITGGTIFNNEIGVVGGTRWDQNNGVDETLVEAEGSEGRMFATSIRGTSQGINSNFGPAGFDTDFDTAANAFLYGTFDFDIVGAGTANFTISGNGDVAFTDRAFDQITPTLQSGTFTAAGVAVPEPSSLALLAFGAVGFVARRRRS